MAGWHHGLDGRESVNSGRCWWTGRPGVLRFRGSRNVGHDWVTELHWMNWFWSILVHWFLKCQCLLFSSPVWLLPICVDSWNEHSRFLCSIVLYNIRLYFHHQSCPQLGFFFHIDSASSVFLELFLYCSPVAYWGPTDLERSSFSVFLPFHTVHRLLKARILM